MRSPAERIEQVSHRAARRALSLAVLLVAGACSAGDSRGAAAEPPPSAGAETVTVAASAAQAARMAPPASAALTNRLAAEEQEAIRRLPAGDGRAVVVSSCLPCHSASMIEQQRKDTTAWRKTIATMVSWGASVPADQQPVLMAYLSDRFPARGAGAPARPAP